MMQKRHLKLFYEKHAKTLSIARTISLIALILMFLLVTLRMSFAETIVVGSTEEDKVYGTNETNQTAITPEIEQQLIEVLKDLKVSDEEREYLIAINDRLEKSDIRYEKIVGNLEDTTKKQLRIITEQADTIQKLNDKLKTSTEDMNTQIVILTQEIEKEKIIKYVWMLIIFVTTVFVSALGDSLTKGKKIYFWGKKIRDEMPINASVIIGKRGD